MASTSTEEELNKYRTLIQTDEHVQKFLVTHGFGAVNIEFSYKKTEFKEAGKLHMAIQTTERSGASEIKVNIPVPRKEPKDDSLDSKFYHQSTGVPGQYTGQQRHLQSVPLSDCLKSLILYCNFQHVLVVQHGSRLRNYYIYGPSLMAVIERLKEQLYRNSSLKLTGDDQDLNFQLKTFIQKVLDAHAAFTIEELGAMVPLVIAYDEEKYKSTFHLPVKEGFYAGGRTFDILKVQGVVLDHVNRSVMLDLGIYFHINKLSKDTQLRLTTLQHFCMNFGLNHMSMEVHYNSKPDLSSTFMFGPLYYHGPESLESLQNALIGAPCVYLSMETASKTNFSIKIEPVGALMLEMDQSKQGTSAFQETRDPASIALTLYQDIRSGSNLLKRELILTEEEMLRQRKAEYGFYS